MKKVLKVIAVLILLFILSLLLGPKVKYEAVDNNPISLQIPLAELESYVAKLEAKTTDIKPDNQSRIIWSEGIEKTEYALVYLHGFEASWAESDPIISNFADRYGCNTYMARISEQGRIHKDAMADESPKGMIESAKQAIAIGKLLGEKLIVLSCSTGSTYSAYLAANDPDIYAQIMTSPNFDLADPNSKIMTKPWGKQILRQIIGDDYREFTPPPDARPYWNNRYRIEGLIALRSLIDQTMTTDIWRKNKTPIFIAYFYQDEMKKDNIISIAAIDEFAKTVSTDQNELKVIPISAGHGHVISSKYMNDQWEVTQDSIFAYADKILNMKLHTQSISISN